MSRRIASSIAIVSGFALVVVCLPIFLISFGSPFTDFFAVIGDLFTSPSSLAAESVIQLLVVVAWIFWFQLLYASATEVLARINGHRSSDSDRIPNPVAHVVSAAFFLLAATPTEASAAVAEDIPSVVEPAISETDSVALVDADLQYQKHVVQKGDSWFQLATQYMQDGHEWPQIRNANIGNVMPDGTEISADTDTIKLGWTLNIPVAPIAVQMEHPVVSNAGTQVEQAPIRSDYKSFVFGLGLGGGTVAANLLMALYRRRRLAIVTRKSGTEPLHDGLALSPMEHALETVADHDLLELVCNSVSEWATTSSRVPAVINLSPSDFFADVYTADGNSQTIGLDFTPTSELYTNAVPMIATIGRNLQINLEAIGALNIVGTSAHRMGIIRSIIHEVGLRNLEVVVDIRATQNANMGELCAMQSCEDLTADLLDPLTESVVEMTQAGFENVFEQRTNGEATESCYLLVAHENDVDDLSELVEIAKTQQQPLAIVVLSDHQLSDFDYQLTVTRSGTQLAPFGLEFDPQLMSQQVSEAFLDLEFEAAEPQYVPLDVTPITTLTTPDSDTLLLQVLGEPATLERPDLTPQQLSLLAYVTLIGPSTKSQIIDAVWDGQRISNKRFANLVSETRRAVGRSILPDAKDGKYRIANVVTDLSLLATAYEADTKGKKRIRSLEETLGRVSGVPFATPENRYWHWISRHSHLYSTAECLVADAAMDLAQRYFDASDYENAATVAERGLLAVPLDETLTSLLVRCYRNLGKMNIAARIVSDWELTTSDLGYQDPSLGPRKQLVAVD